MCSCLILAQQKIQILDNSINLPISHVQLYDAENQILATSDSNGFALLAQDVQIIYIDHPGFPPQSFQLPVENNIIFLNAELVHLKDIQIVANDDKSLNLIKKVIENQKKNNPKSLSNYRYISHAKFWADTNSDSIDYIPNPVSKGDSAQNDFKQLIDESMLFLSERAVTHYYDQKHGSKDIVEAARISGLQSPLYEVMALQPISTEFNENEFNFFFRTFTNPLSNAGLKSYNYVITDSIQSNDNTFVRVSFNSKRSEKNSLHGFVEIYLDSYALTKFYAENQNKSGTETYVEMIYAPFQNVWIPERQIFKLETENVYHTSRQDSVSPSGEIIENRIKKKSKSWINSYTTYSNFESPVDLDRDTFKGYSFEVGRNAFREFENKIKDFRQEPLTSRELNTYVKIDSIGKAEKIDRSIKIVRLITQQGWLNFNKVDFYIPDLLQFNDYEDYRIGLNFRTSHHFSNKIGFNARTYYGTGDKVFKYGLGSWLNINPNISSQIFVDYSDDIASSGRFKHPSMNLFHVLNHLREQSSDYLFVDKVRAQLGYRQDLFENINFELSFNTARERSLFEYQFQDNPLEKTFTTNSIQAAFRYAPKEKGIQTPIGKVSFTQGFPIYYLSIDQGLDVFSGENEFTRLEFNMHQRFNLFQSPTYFNLRMGKVFGEVPVWHYFDGPGRARYKPSFWQRARVGGSQIFETMIQGEFISDQFVMGSLKQRIFNLRLSKSSNIPFDLIYKAAYGSLENTENHQHLEFQQMDQIYQEAGLEVGSLFGKLLGIGVYYRFGAYNLGDFEKDFSAKLILNFGR